MAMMVPQNIVNIYVYINNSTCENDKNLIAIGRPLGFLALFYIILNPFLIRRKLSHFT